jgi:hypothetical protein
MTIIISDIGRAAIEPHSCVTVRRASDDGPARWVVTVIPTEGATAKATLDSVAARAIGLVLANDGREELPIDPDDLGALAAKRMADRIESYRRALLRAHGRDWDMDTISQAAHICAHVRPPAELPPPPTPEVVWHDADSEAEPDGEWVWLHRPGHAVRKGLWSPGLAAWAEITPQTPPPPPRLERKWVAG